MLFRSGARLEIRSDDREDVVRGRLRAYDQLTAPVLAYFKEAGYPVWDVQGDGASPDVISGRIVNLITEEFSGRKQAQ